MVKLIVCLVLVTYFASHCHAGKKEKVHIKIVVPKLIKNHKHTKVVYIHKHEPKKDDHHDDHGHHDEHKHDDGKKKVQHHLVHHYHYHSAKHDHKSSNKHHHDLDHHHKHKHGHDHKHKGGHDHKHSLHSDNKHSHKHAHKDEKGHEHKGHDHKGHDHKGHDHKGHDHKGHDHKGHDHKGHDHKGYDHKSHGKYVFESEYYHPHHEDVEEYAHYADDHSREDDQRKGLYYNHNQHPVDLKYQYMGGDGKLHLKPDYVNVDGHFRLADLHHPKSSEAYGVDDAHPFDFTTKSHKHLYEELRSEKAHDDHHHHEEEEAYHANDEEAEVGSDSNEDHHHHEHSGGHVQHYESDANDLPSFVDSSSLSFGR